MDETKEFEAALVRVIAEARRAVGASLAPSFLMPQTVEESRIDLAESLDWLDRLPAESAGGLITDPPYSSGGAFRADRCNSNATSKYINSEQRKNYQTDFAGDSRDQRAWSYWVELVLRKALRVVEPGGVCAVSVDWRQLATLTDAMQVAGWIFRGIVPWDKTEGTRPVLGRFRSQCEYWVWGSKGRLDLERDAPVLPGCIRRSVSRNKKHPTQKPVEMLRIVSRIVERGRPIIDPFSGSGAHGVAAVLEGHPFLGCEMVPQYAESGAKWLAETLEHAANNPPLFDGDLSDPEQFFLGSDEE